MTSLFTLPASGGEGRWSGSYFLYSKKNKIKNYKREQDCNNNYLGRIDEFACSYFLDKNCMIWVKQIITLLLVIK